MGCRPKTLSGSVAVHRAPSLVLISLVHHLRWSYYITYPQSLATSLSSACNAGPSPPVSRVHTEGRLFWSGMGSPFIFFLLLASLADMRSPAIAITAAGIVDVTNPVIDRKIERSQLHSTPETKCQVISMVIVERRDCCTLIPRK